MELLVVFLLFLEALPTYGQDLTVTIAVDYTPPADFDRTSESDYRAASSVTLTCQVEGATGTVSYQWTSTCSHSDCFVRGETGQSVSRSYLRADVDGGNHTCTATDSDGGETGSDSTVMNIVAAGVYVIAADSTNVPTGALTNNGIVVALSTGTDLYSTTVTIRFQCRSGSTNNDPSPQFIGLDGTPLSSGTVGKLSISVPNHPSAIRVDSRGNAGPTAEEEGVYTCRMRDENEETVEVNVGIYRNGFNAPPNITSLTFDPDSFNLTCTSTGSPATNVTWMKDGSPLVIDGTTYSMEQTVTGRSTSTYNNVLTIGVDSSTIPGNYGCEVRNALGSSGQRFTSISGLFVEFTNAGSQTAGSTDYTVTCMVKLIELLGTPSVTWLAPGGSMVSPGADFTVGAVTGSGTTYSSVLMFNTLKTSLAGEYTCNATLDSETTVSTTLVSVTIHTPSLDITPDPDQTLYSGENVTLTCTITLDPTVDSGVAVTASWTGPGGSITTGVVNMTDAVPYQSSLTLSSLTTSDTGDYTCTASVDDSPPTSLVVASDDGTDTLGITVEDYTVSITASGTSALGEMYNLYCTVEGVSVSPTIQWLGPDGSEITTGVSTTTSSSTLTLSDLSLPDAGEYTCRSTLSGVVREVMEEVNLQVLPDVSARNDGSGTIYAGSVLTMTCEAALPSSVQDIVSDFSVTISWTRASTAAVTGGGRITVQPAAPVSPGSRFFESTVEFDTLRAPDSDIYTCTATVTPSGSQPFLTGEQASDTTTIAVVNPTIAVTVEANTTRLPTEPPYNTFTILCTASVPDGVIAAKRFTWRRRIGPSITGLDPITDGEDTIIESSDLTEAVSTSRLTVTDDTAGDYRYRCRTDIDDLDDFDCIREIKDVYPIDVIGEAAPSFTGLTATSDLYGRATIQWTVPVVTYTPETYVVNYGTDMGMLDSESETLSGGSDFEATGLQFSVQLTGLIAVTVYYYQLVATNTFTSTSSDIMNFTTPEQVNFQVTAVGTDTLQFSWDPPDFTNGEPNSYNLSCVSTFPPELQQIFSKDYIVDNITRTMSINDTVSEFSPGVTYLCSVVSSNSAWAGQSVTQNVSTLPDYPGPMSNVRWLPQGESAVKIEWEDPTAPNGVITTFIVKLLRYNDSVEVDSETIDVGNNYTVTFSDAQISKSSVSDPFLPLSPCESLSMPCSRPVAGVPYNYSVVAVNSVGRGQEMFFTNFAEVLPAPPPADVDVQRSTSGREMTVSWTRLTLVEAHGFVQFYLITIQIGQSSTKRQEGGGHDISLNTLRASAASDSLTVTGLDPSTAYGVTVTAANGLQEPPSDPEEVDEASVTLGDTSVVQRVEDTESGGGGGDIGVIIGVFVVGIIIGAVAVGIVITGIVIYRWRHAELSLQKQQKKARNGGPWITTTECAAYGTATTSLPLQNLTTDPSHDYEVITARNSVHVPTRQQASTEQNTDTGDGVYENDVTYEEVVLQ